MTASLTDDIASLSCLSFYIATGFGEFAKTHSGIWTRFSQVFVAPGEFDQQLASLAMKLVGQISAQFGVPDPAEMKRLGITERISD